MTTTAGKIEKLNQDLIEAQGVINALQRELVKITQEARKETKPPDPEPLERWITTYPPDEFTSDNAHRSAELARKHAIPGKALRVGVHMREVTPQDEQDREDAQRLRNWEKFFGGGNTLEEMLKDAARFRGLQQMCRFHTTTWSKLEYTPVERWHEIIDKAMEEK